MVYAAIAHCGEDGFAKWAAAHALPVTTIDFAGNDSDLLPLESVMGTAHVVALGEPTHGAHEPLALRNRLFRFLVERMGFTAIALEQVVIARTVPDVGYSVVFKVASVPQDVGTMMLPGRLYL